MKTILTTILLAGFTFSVAGQGFINLNFEQANVVVNEPTYGFLNWNQAAPGWSHSSGGDTGTVYYRNEHLGLSQYYLLMDSTSPVYAPGTHLAGNYSLAFASGHLNGGDFNSPWVQAYISQTGTIPGTARSIRFLARGSFSVLVNGVTIPMQSLGGNAYGGDITGFAGTSAEFKIVNTSLQVHNPVIADNIFFSAVPVPEPSHMVLGIMALVSWRFYARRQQAQRRLHI